MLSISIITTTQGSTMSKVQLHIVNITIITFLLQLYQTKVQILLLFTSTYKLPQSTQLHITTLLIWRGILLLITNNWSVTTNTLLYAQGLNTTSSIGHQITFLVLKRMIQTPITMMSTTSSQKTCTTLTTLLTCFGYARGNIQSARNIWTVKWARRYNTFFNT